MAKTNNNFQNHIKSNYVHSFMAYFYRINHYSSSWEFLYGRKKKLVSLYITSRYVYILLLLLLFLILFCSFNIATTTNAILLKRENQTKKTLRLYMCTSTTSTINISFLVRTNSISIFKLC